MSTAVTKDSDLKVEGREVEKDFGSLADMSLASNPTKTPGRYAEFSPIVKQANGDTSDPAGDMDWLSLTRRNGPRTTSTPGR
jgi:hypothetical protein